MCDIPPSEEPVGLLDYCEQRGFYGLSLWVFIAYFSRTLAGRTTDDAELQTKVANHYASYLLGYALWVGMKHDSFSTWKPDGSAALKNIPSPLSLYLKRVGDIKHAKDVIDFIQQFNSEEKNLSRSRLYLGWFCTELPLESVLRKLRSQGVFLKAHCEKWGWTAETVEQAMQRIVDKIPFPADMLNEEPEELREFWNFALIGIVTEMECKWRVEERFTKWTAIWVLLTKSTQIIRELVVGRKLIDF
jgi:hypothetical protein